MKNAKKVGWLERRQIIWTNMAGAQHVGNRSKTKEAKRQQSVAMITLTSHAQQPLLLCAAAQPDELASCSPSLILLQVASPLEQVF